MRGKQKTVDTTIRTERREADGIAYKYDLIMRESSRVSSYRLPLYSISVEMTQEDTTVTSAETHEVFADVGRAIVFFEKLVDNLATPIDLPYIVEDELTK
jgi:hypothetical protein